MFNNRWILAAFALMIAASGCTESNENGASCDESFTPTCYDAYQQIVCEQGLKTVKTCNGVCDAATGECHVVQVACIVGVSYPYCENNLRVTCDNGYVSKNLCATNEVCSNGICTLPGSCSSKADCSASQDCVNGVCTDSLGCVQTGCSTGFECNATSGECEPVQSVKSCVETGCSTGFECNATSGECEPVQAVKSCVETGCSTGFECNATSGECEPVQAVKSCVETGCSQGFECNATSGECEPVQAVKSCVETGCREGYSCDTKSGNCVLNDPDVVECETLSISGSDTCEKTGAGATIVLKGDVLALNKTYKGGMVVVSNGKIQYVGCAANNNADISSATVISCPNAVISPSLINGHDHLTFSNTKPSSWGNIRYDHRHDWRKGLNGHTKLSCPGTSDNEVVEMRAIMAGTTAIFGSSSVSGLTRNIDDDEINGVKTKYETFPLDDNGGDLYEHGCTKYGYANSVEKFNESCPFGPHVAEGINQSAVNELRCLSGEGAGSFDIFKPNTAIIHGIAAAPDMVAKMAANGVKLIWSPRTNIALYGDTAQVPLYDRMGVTIGLGTDWIYSGSANMLRELACIDYLNQNHYSLYFSDYQLWKMPTYNNAVAFGLENSLGQLKEGLLADIAIFKKYPNVRESYRAVIEAENKDVTLVMIGGTMMYGDANIMSNGETVDVCGVSKKVNASGNGGSYTYSRIKAASKYNLFFCSDSELIDEPTCVPMRTRPEDTTSQNTTLYNGDYTASNDADGDGIPDSEDNCPTVFNPVRPQYTDHKQADYDGDGYGDICDPYPLCASNDDTCKAYNVNDRDNDGVENVFDNCPDVANPDQIDGDRDGVGDLCDECPEEKGELTNGCPLKISEIKDIRSKYIAGTLWDGTTVLVEGVVTAIAKKYDLSSNVGFFIQDDVDPAGVYIYNQTAADSVHVGDKVRVEATVRNYYNMLELEKPVVTALGTASIPAPVLITAEQAEGDKSPYNSAIVQVTGIKTTELTEKGTWNGVNAAGTAAYVDDFIIGTSPLSGAMSTGKTYDVTGILVYDFGASKVAPRSTSDIVLSGSFAELNGPETADWNSSVTITAKLSSNASADTSAAISCTGASCPTTAVIPAGSDTVSFQITMPSSGNAGVTVTIDGNQLSLTIIGVDANAPVSVAKLSPETLNIQPGNSETIALTLNKASSTATTVSLSSDNPDITVPSTTTVAAGSRTATFNVTASASAADGASATITANVGSTAAKTMTVAVKSSAFANTYSEDFKAAVDKSTDYSAVYTKKFSSSIELKAVGNFEDTNAVYKDSVVLTANTSKDTYITVSGLKGVGTVTVDWTNYSATCPDNKCTFTVTAGTRTQTFEFTQKQAEVTDFTFDDVSATFFTIKPGKGIAANNKQNRMAVNNVSWTTSN